MLQAINLTRGKLFDAIYRVQLKLTQNDMKHLILLVAFLLTTTILFGQSVEVTPMAGYTFSGNVDGYYGTYDLKNTALYGAKLDVEIEHRSYVELSYRRIDPKLTYSTNGIGINDKETSTATAHYMVGYLYEFTESKIIPYGVINVGTSRYWEKGDSNERKWFFSTEFGAGAKMFISDMIGIRMQASVTTPWDFTGGGLYWGIGGGGSAGMTFHVPLAHWDFSAGIIIRKKN